MADEILDPAWFQQMCCKNEHTGSQWLSFFSQCDIQVKQRACDASLIAEMYVEVDSLHVGAQVGRLMSDLSGQITQSLLPPVAGIQPELLCSGNTECGVDIGIDHPNVLELMLLTWVGNEVQFRSRVRVIGFLADKGF